MTEPKDSKYYAAKCLESIDQLWKDMGHDNFDLAYNWIQSQPNHVEAIRKAEQDFNASCAAGEPPNRIRQWALAWFRSWKIAVGYATRHLMQMKEDKDGTNCG
jgi:hypothetical protein